MHTNNDSDEVCSNTFSDDFCVDEWELEGLTDDSCIVNADNLEEQSDFVKNTVDEILDNIVDSDVQNEIVSKTLEYTEDYNQCCKPVDVVLSELKDNEILDKIDRSENPTGTMNQRIHNNPSPEFIVEDSVPVKMKKQVAIEYPAHLNDTDYSCNVGSIWSILQATKSDRRFLAALEVCATEVGTVNESVEYLIKSFPILKKFNFDVPTFNQLVEIQNQCCEAWNAGELGDKIGDRTMLRYAREIADSKFHKDELTMRDINIYANTRDTFENITIRRQLADAKLEAFRQSQINNSADTSFTFTLSERGDTNS